jgi:hypothetical protein
MITTSKGHLYFNFKDPHSKTISQSIIHSVDDW